MKKFSLADCSIIGPDFHSIKVRLVRLNKDQLDLCRAIGVTPSCMSNWLSMATNMPYVARCAIELFLCKSEIESFGYPYSDGCIALCNIRELYCSFKPIVSEASSKQGLVSESHPSELLG